MILPVVLKGSSPLVLFGGGFVVIGTKEARPQTLKQ